MTNVARHLCSNKFSAIDTIWQHYLEYLPRMIESRGILLSEDTLRSLRDVFNSVSLRLPINTEYKDLFAARHIALRDSSFPSFYRALYMRAITGQYDTISPQEYMNSSGIGSNRERSLEKKLTLELTSNLYPFRKKHKSEDKFYNSLLDEFVIADILNLRNEILESIPLPTFCSDIEFGCTYLKFDVYTNSAATVADLEGTLSTQGIDDSDHWKGIFQRYGVKLFEVRPS